MKHFTKDFFRLFTVDTTFWAVLAFCLPFIDAYYRQVGLDAFQIGILSAVGPIATITIQPLWARLSDMTGRRRLVLRIVAVCAGAAYLVYLWAESFMFFLVVTIAFYVFFAAIQPINTALVTHYATATGSNYAYVRLGGTIAFAIIVFIFGGYLSGHPKHMFIASTAVFVIYAFVCLLLPKDGERLQAPQMPEPDAAPDAAHGDAQASGAAGADAGGAASADPDAQADKGGRIFKTGRVVFVLILAFVIQTALSFFNMGISIYSIDAGYDQGLIGILYCVAALSEIPILLSVKKVLAKMDTLMLLFLTGGFTAVRVILVIGGTPTSMAIAQLMSGLTYMFAYYGCVTFISDNVMPGKMSQGQSVLMVMQSGLANICGMLGGGWIVERIGIIDTFKGMAGFAAVATLLCFVAYRIYEARAKAIRQ